MLVALLLGTCCPQAGIEVGEDVVAELDLSEAGFLSKGETARLFEGLVDGFDLVELVVMGEEANLGVVARGSGGDEELPVGGLEEEEFAAELLDDAFADV